MSKRKKKRVLSPRAKRMSRAARLQSAKSWIPKYEGKNIAKGYREHFGVDALCAVVELQRLGVALDAEYVKQVKATSQRQSQRPKRPKGPKGADPFDVDWDSNDHFAYIAGYTSGGAAYGVTWDEWEELDGQADDQGERQREWGPDENTDGRIPFSD